MKKIIAITLSIIMIFTMSACSNNNEKHLRLENENWAEDVKSGINDMLDAYGKDSKNYNEDSYAIFDFDNTCSIFDVEEQLSIYQLNTMSFNITPEELPDVLFTGLGDKNIDRTDLGYGKGSYHDWVDDIVNAYSKLYDEYGPFTVDGVTEDVQAKLQLDPYWNEFATKMRAMYDLISDAEGADVAYPWILYWFSNMTEDDVYALAKKSHNTFKNVETDKIHWESPKEIDSKVGVVSYDWTAGIQVTDNIRELFSVLDDNGIDVWVCSASGIDVIRAGIDEFGLHEYVTGVLAMTNILDDGFYINQYNYNSGRGYYAKKNGEWEKMKTPENAQTQGDGKIDAIMNAIYPDYNNRGPIAGFMDSTGDFNMCTEFDSLKLVTCFNRANRKVTDGGGLIAEIAMYEKDTLGYDFYKADENGDTLYVLQGRDENGLRTLRPSNKTILFGDTNEKLFRNEDNEAVLNYIIENNMTVENAINKFAIKTDENNELGFKYGFLNEYEGYHNIK